MSQSEVFDKRTISRKIKREVTSQEAYDQHVESLEDCSEMLEVVEAEFTRRSETAAVEDTAESAS